MLNHLARAHKNTTAQHKKKRISEKRISASHSLQPPSHNRSFIHMGRFGRPYGVRGWLHVFSFTDPVENILAYSPWFAGPPPYSQQPLIVETGKRHGQHLIVKLLEINDRDSAQAFTNNLITLSKDQLPLLNEGEYYWQELIGSRVLTKTQQPLGIVKKVLPTGANDILVLSSGQREHLIPYIESVIVHVDRENKIIVVDWDPEY